MIIICTYLIRNIGQVPQVNAVQLFAIFALNDFLISRQMTVGREKRND